MEGSLARTPLAQVLKSICDRSDSVVLRLENGQARKLIYIRDGDVAFASSDRPEDRLGERLVRSGAVSREQIELACRVQSESKLRLGETLVEMGCLTAEELDERVRDQIASIVRASMGWRSGSFSSSRHAYRPDADLERFDLSTMDLLFDEAGADADVDVDVDADADADADAGTGAGNRARREPEGTRSRPERDFDGGLLRIAGTASNVFEAGLRLTPEEGFVLSRVDGSSTASQIARLSPLGEQETFECLRALVSAGLLEIIPDVARAGRFAPSSERTVGKTPTNGEPRSATSPRVLPSELSPENARFRQRMLDKHARLETSSHYELLDLASTASTSEIKAAYFALAKKLHPDHRAGLKLDDANGAFTDLYFRIKTAYEVLSDATERKVYDRSLARARPTKVWAGERPGGGGGPRRGADPTQRARAHFANGSRFFESGQYHEAIEELRSAVRLDEQRIEYQRLLGRALGKNPKWRKLAEEHFMIALTLNRFDAATYVELGELYLDAGLRTRARKMFEEAVGIDPDNARAQHGLEAVRRSSGASSHESR